LIAQLHSRIQFLEGELARVRDLRAAFEEVVRREAAALPPMPAWRPQKRSSRGKREPLVAMLDNADMHVGELVTPEETGGLNSYDLEECRRRAARLVEGALMALREHPVRVLYINILGDVVTGERIYPGQPWRIDAPLLQQVFEAEEILLGVVASLAKAVPQVRVVTVAGNHGRLGKPGEYHPATNMDTLVYILLAKRLSQQRRVSVEVGDAPWALYAVPELGGQAHLLLHGEGIRTNLSIPYYGLDRATREWGQTIGQAIDYVHLGHFHRAAQIQTPPGEQLVSGSWVGATPYTLRQFREAVVPRQHLYIFDAGGLRCSYRIDLAPRARLKPDKRGFFVVPGGEDDEG
jgi:hypothetical protein